MMVADSAGGIGGLLAIYLVFWIVSGLIGMAIGASKGRAGAGFVLGLFLGFIGWIIAACLSKSPQKQAAEYMAVQQQMHLMGAANPYVANAYGVSQPHLAAHEDELRAWVERGGALCEQCKEPLNPGASRCRTCNAAQSVAAPLSMMSDRPLPPPPDEVTPEQESVAFFADELKNVAPVSIVGRSQTGDERLLLAPFEASVALRNERTRRRCERLVRAAMDDAGQRIGWTWHEGMRLPQSWVEPYEVLADLDEDRAPAIIVLIERVADALR